LLLSTFTIFISSSAYAEHAGGEFTNYVAKGDGLQSGDTIEIHYVHSSAQIELGPTLGACLAESIMNPKLRVEAQVYALVNDEGAVDFAELTAVDNQSGYHQATGIPNGTSTPVVYAGATT
jgi:hypothetical protein